MRWLLVAAGLLCGCGGRTNLDDLLADGLTSDGSATGSAADASLFVGSWTCSDTGTYEESGVQILSTSRTDIVTFASLPSGMLSMTGDNIVLGSIPTHDDGGLTCEAYSFYPVASTATAKTGASCSSAGSTLTLTQGSFVLSGTGGTFNLVTTSSGPNVAPGTNVIDGTCTKIPSSEANAD